MSRGGRGGGRGGRRNGPDLSWEDADLDQPSSTLYEKPSNTPGPLFPPRLLRTPKPLSDNEKAAAQGYLAFRSRCRRGPLYTVLDPSERIDDSTGKANKRVGFDPFNGQDRYSSRSAISKTSLSNDSSRNTKAAGVSRTIPDLSTDTGRGTYGYTLRLFPTELWGILDPQQESPEWVNVKEDSLAYASLGKRSATLRRRDKKRKRGTTGLKLESTVQEGDDQSGSDDEDSVIDSSRRRRRTGTGSRAQRHDSSKAKRGLEAEDDYPDIDQDADENEDDGPGGTGGANDEDEPEDSEFEESEDGQGDDYNAEQYFDAGDEDEFGDGDGDLETGGAY